MAPQDGLALLQNYHLGFIISFHNLVDALLQEDGTARTIFILIDIVSQIIKDIFSYKK